VSRRNARAVPSRLDRAAVCQDAAGGVGRQGRARLISAL
jgi:hypothetical protein